MNHMKKLITLLLIPAGLFAELNTMPPAPPTAPDYADTGKVSSVPVTTTPVVLAPHNRARVGLIVYNGGGNKVYISVGTTCNTTATPLAALSPDEGFALSSKVAYRGPICAVRGSGSGLVNITEFINDTAP